LLIFLIKLSFVFSCAYRKATESKDKVGPASSARGNKPTKQSAKEKDSKR